MTALKSPYVVYLIIRGLGNQVCEICHMKVNLLLSLYLGCHGHPVSPCISLYVGVVSVRRGLDILGVVELRTGYFHCDQIMHCTVVTRLTTMLVVPV